MQAYVVRRLLLALVSIVGLSILVFVLLRVAPGDPAILVLGEDAGAEALDDLRRTLGLDRPLPIQYLDWAWGVLRGDVGESVFTGRSVVSEVRSRLPVTLELAAIALVWSLVIGVPLGAISAVKQDSVADNGLRLFAIINLATPNFWIATMVIVFSARWFGWIPPVGYTSILEDPGRNAQQFILPGILVGLSLSASLMRMTRSSVLEVLREDFVRTARAKGLREETVIYRHVLKNAFIPVVTVFALQVGAMITGIVITENIFNLPGLGRLILDAINRRDYPLVQGIVLLIGVVVVAINLVTDLIYAVLDPRIRYA